MRVLCTAVRVLAEGTRAKLNDFTLGICKTRAILDACKTAPQDLVREIGTVGSAPSESVLSCHGDVFCEFRTFVSNLRLIRALILMRKCLVLLGAFSFRNLGPLAVIPFPHACLISLTFLSNLKMLYFIPSSAYQRWDKFRDPVASFIRLSGIPATVSVILKFLNKYMSFGFALPHEALPPMFTDSYYFFYELEEQARLCQSAPARTGFLFRNVLYIANTTRLYKTDVSC